MMKLHKSLFLLLLIALVGCTSRNESSIDSTSSREYPTVDPVFSLHVYEADDTEAEVSVPVRSVQQSADGCQFVWLAKDGKASRQPVEVGQAQGDRIIIYSGLAEGDKVIVEGYQKVSEGSEIRD